MAQPVTEQQQFQIAYVDRPDVCETFADSVEKINFDGVTWRFEFCVTRLAEPKPPAVPGNRYPSCRLVLTAQAGLDLAGKLKGLVEHLEKQGVIKNTPAAALTRTGGTKPS